MKSFGTRRFSVALAAAVTPALSGAIFLDVGEHRLLPETAGQAIQVFYRTDDPSTPPLAGLDFIFEIRPLGQVMPNAGLTPSVTSVNLMQNTPFAGFGATQTGDVGNTGRLQIWNVTVPTRGVYPELPLGASTLLASLTIDTTGIESGSFEFLLKDSAAGTTALWDSSGFQPLDLRIQNGTLVVVPEIPGMFTMGVMLLLGGWVVRSRR